MLRYFALFLVLLSFPLIWAQSSNAVTIKGYAPSYIGEAIQVMQIEDYFSKKESKIATTTVENDSTFNVSFSIEETQKIVIYAGKNNSHIYIQPGGIYNLYLPKEDKYGLPNPNGSSIEATFLDLDTSDINFKILQFERWNDEFISNYYHLRKKYPADFAKRLDQFKTNVEKYYNWQDSSGIAVSNAGTYFQTYVRFSIATLDNIQFAASRNRNEKHDFYIKYAPVAYKNDAYMHYISTFYEKMIPRLSMETGNRVYLGLLKSSPTLIMRALGGEYTLINMRIRELVMVKALSEQYFENQFPQTNILAVLDSVAQHSLFAANGIFAKNMIDRLTELVTGGQAPNFVLFTDKKLPKTLENFKNKYLYIHFYDPTNARNVLEIDPLLKIYETYKHEIEFITVYEGKKGEIATTDENLNRIPWQKFKEEKSNPIWKNYKVVNLPSYVLIDRFGYVVSAPALGPMPDSNYKTIDETFFHIQKAVKEQKRIRN